MMATNLLQRDGGSLIMNVDRLSVPSSGVIFLVCFHNKRSNNLIDPTIVFRKAIREQIIAVKNKREAKVSSPTQEFIDTLKVGSESVPDQRWKRAVEKVLANQSRTNYREHIQISMTEHMSSVDVFDGENVRKGLECRSGTVDELGIIWS
jgi:hypothetical protein